MACRERSSDVNVEGDSDVRASGMSGLSRTRRVLRCVVVVVVVREEIEVEMVDLRCARSTDVSV